MERRASRIVKAVVVLVGIVMAVLMLVCMLVCVTTYIANYLRRMVMAMNDEAASAGGTEEEAETESAGNIHNGGADLRGLDKEAIEKLPMVVYHHYQQQKHVQKKAEEAAAAAGHEGEDGADEDGAGGGVRTLGLDCGVCLADFQEMELLRMLPACQHCFHPSCIEKWLSSHSTCPLCRHSLLPTSLQLSTIHVHIHTIDGPLMAASPPRLARA